MATGSGYGRRLLPVGMKSGPFEALTGGLPTALRLQPFECSGSGGV
jgi:hypothetical protein